MLLNKQNIPADLKQILVDSIYGYPMIHIIMGRKHHWVMLSHDTVRPNDNVRRAEDLEKWKAV